MSTPIKVINAGLAKLSAQRVANIAPARTSLESFVAEQYPQWRDAELASRRWAFAMRIAKLTLTGNPDASLAQRNAFLLPNDCLRALRDDVGVGPADWEQRGRLLYTERNEMSVKYIARVLEDEFDPTFFQVLACRVAVECAEYITQSNQKKADADGLYQAALRRAASVNAFTRGAEVLTGAGYDDTTAYSWTSGRY